MLKKQHLTDIDRDVRVRIYIVDQRDNFRVKRVFIAVPASVAVELDVRHVTAMAFQRPHRFQGRFPIARDTEIVAVNVDWVGNPEVVHGVGHFPYDLAGRHIKMIDR